MNTVLHATHHPVLLAEVVQSFSHIPISEGIQLLFLDGTLGLGGHTEALLRHYEGMAKILGLDRDRSALDLAQLRLQQWGDSVQYYHSTFSNYKSILLRENIHFLDGALFDLGVSSLQLDTAERGFSFKYEAPLDMRMDTTMPETAQHLLAHISFPELVQILHEYGEEPCAKKIARAILAFREHNTITTTKELATIITSAYPKKWVKTARIHPATRTFQALRIAVNNELKELETMLSQIILDIRSGGILAIITFHSLEDRIVKLAFRRFAKPCSCSPLAPRCTCTREPIAKILTKKPILPTNEEIAINPRARSAKLRVLQKL